MQCQFRPIDKKLYIFYAVYIALGTLLLNCRFVKLHWTPPLRSIQNRCLYSIYILRFNGENCKIDEDGEEEKRIMITSPSIWRV